MPTTFLVGTGFEWGKRSKMTSCMVGVNDATFLFPQNYILGGYLTYFAIVRSFQCFFILIRFLINKFYLINLLN